jgi:hypothetical protein
MATLAGEMVLRLDKTDATQAHVLYADDERTSVVPERLRLWELTAWQNGCERLDLKNRLVLDDDANAV